MLKNQEVPSVTLYKINSRTSETMGSNQRNLRLILEGEDDEAIYTLEATFQPINQPINLARDERTISIEPLVDAPIVSVKSAEVKPPTQTESEVNIATLIIGGIMLGSICFGVGYLVGTAQHQPCNFEVKQ